MPGGSLTSKPTRWNASGCSATSALLCIQSGGMAPSARRTPMEKSDSSRWRRMEEASMSFRKPSAFQPFLKRVCRATSARAHWLALGFLLTVGIFSYWNTSTLIETTNSKIQHCLLLNELQSLLATVNDAERGQRGYLLVGEQSYLAPYENAVRVVDQEIERVGKLMIAVPGQQSAFADLKRLTAMKFAELKETVQVRQSAGIAA